MIPSYDDILRDIENSISEELPDLNVSRENTMIRAFEVAQATTIYNLYLYFENAIKQAFPWSSDGENLEEWAAYEGISRYSADYARGSLVVLGDVGTVIPLGTKFAYHDVSFTSLAESEIISYSVGASLKYYPSSGLLSATTYEDQKFYVGQEITISGAAQSGLNGVKTISDISDSRDIVFSVEPYQSFADDTCTIDAEFASVSVISDVAGPSSNVPESTKMRQSAIISGVSFVWSNWEGIAGGYESETDEHLWRRLFESRKRVSGAYFSKNDIKNILDGTPGVTRYLILRGHPRAPSVTIYFLRDNDENVEPTSSEIQEVFDILQPRIPIGLNDENLIISAPPDGELIYEIDFTAISPDTAALRIEVEKNINRFFKTVPIGGTIRFIDVNSIIFNTRDPETGSLVESFTESGDILTRDVSLSQGQYALKSTITWSIT